MPTVSRTDSGFRVVVRRGFTRLRRAAGADYVPEAQGARPPVPDTPTDYRHPAGFRVRVSGVPVLWTTTGVCAAGHEQDVTLVGRRCESGERVGECAHAVKPAGATALARCGLPLLADNVLAFCRGQRESSATASSAHARGTRACSCNACARLGSRTVFDPRRPGRKVLAHRLPPAREVARLHGWWTPRETVQVRVPGRVR